VRESPLLTARHFRFRSMCLARSSRTCRSSTVSHRFTVHYPLPNDFVFGRQVILDAVVTARQGSHSR